MRTKTITDDTKRKLPTTVSISVWLIKLFRNVCKKFNTTASKVIEKYLEFIVEECNEKEISPLELLKQIKNK